MVQKQFKQLPVGVSDFKKMREKDFLYIDKTQHIYQMITSGEYYFLSRPRRFGKSLLVSTLYELFSGNKALFKDLWIERNGTYNWQTHPIIYLDFGKLDYRTPRRLEQSLHYWLNVTATQYNITPVKTTSIKDLLADLIEKLAKIAPVVVLVDEYDKPILDDIDNTKRAGAQRDLLKNIYSVLKSSDRHLRFLFLTGITKFSKTSIFSGINNLEDMSFDPPYATMLGYTHQELLESFEPYLDHLAQNNGRTFDQTVKTLQTQYNGYCFARNAQSVFNPYSILCCLKKQHTTNYWFESGTPTYLTKLIANGQYDLSNIDRPVLSEAELGTLDIGNIPFTTLLFQAGYLTIKSYDAKSAAYTLDFPNNEVGESFSYLMTQTFAQLTNKRTRGYAQTIAAALRSHDLEKLRDELQDLIDTSPYILQPKQELHLQMTLYNIGRLIGFDIEPEVMTSSGRIDLIITLPDIVYLIELKVNQTAKAAMQQIIDKRYYVKYSDGKKPVELVGVNFDTQTKVVTLVHKALAEI